MAGKAEVGPVQPPVGCPKGCPTQGDPDRVHNISNTNLILIVTSLAFMQLNVLPCHLDATEEN